MYDWAFENLTREEVAQYLLWKTDILKKHPVPLATHYDVIDLDAIMLIKDDEESTEEDIQYCETLSKHLRENPDYIKTEIYPRLPKKIYRSASDLLAAVASVVLGQTTRKDLAAFVNATWAPPETELERDQLLAVFSRVSDGVATADLSYLRCLRRATQAVDEDWFPEHAARVAKAATQIATKCVPAV